MKGTLCRCGLAAVAMLTMAWALPTPVQAQDARPRPAASPPTAETSAAAEPSAVLDLEAAQRHALRDNPSLRAVSERVGQAEQLLQQARSLYYPQAAVRYSYSNIWLPHYLTDPAGEFLGRIETLFDGQPWVDGLVSDLRDRLDDPVETYQLGFAAGWLLFDGFGRHFKHSMARIAVRETEAAVQEGQRLLMAGVARAYFGVQLARENIAIVHSDLAFNERLLDDTRILRDAGRAATSDMLNFEVAVSAARTMLVRAEGEHEAARIALATLMALPDAMLPPEAQVAPLADETPEQMRSPDADQALANALEQRSDLRQGAYAVQRAEAAVRNRYAEFSPQVGVFVRHEAQRFGRAEIRSDDFSTVAGINVQYEVFSGGRRLARVREAKHIHREVELRRRDTELAVTSDVRQALLTLETAQQQLLLQRKTVESVHRNRDLVARSYAAGKETLVRLNMAQRDLVRAESQLALARVELQSAWSDLRSATGTMVAPLGVADGNGTIGREEP